MLLKRTRKLALCGVIAALSTVVLFLTGVLPTATVALPAAAGVLLIPVVAECGTGWGFGAYAVCGALAFLSAPDREAALIYVLFFGYYPVLFGLLEKLGSPVLRWATKLLVFNAAAAAEGLLAVYVLGIPWENIGFLGQATLPVLLVLANVVFVLYDYVLRGFIRLYYQRVQERVRTMLAGR